MTLSDVNLLIYAVDAESPRHGVARRWLDEQLSGSETFGLAWTVLLAFLRLTTNRAVFAQPLTLAQAFDLVDDWLARPSTVVLHPGSRHAVIVRELLEPLGTAGNLVTDAHLAALAIEHGATLVSFDRDFSRFPRLRWVDPLV